MVVMGGAGADYGGDGKDDSGGQSTAMRRCGAAARGRANGGASQHLKGSRSTPEQLVGAEGLGARTSPAMADGGFGCSRGRGYDAG